MTTVISGCNSRSVLVLSLSYGQKVSVHMFYLQNYVWNFYYNRFKRPTIQTKMHFTLHVTQTGVLSDFTHGLFKNSFNNAY